MFYQYMRLFVNQQQVHVDLEDSGELFESQQNLTVGKQMSFRVDNYFVYWDICRSYIFKYNVKRY